MASAIRSFKDLIVWQKAMALAAVTYRVEKTFPAEERYRITSQLLRAATSVPANIAEGHGRGTRKDYAHFLTIAPGSLAETETLFLLAQPVKLLDGVQCREPYTLIDETGRLLNGLLSKLRSSTDTAA